MKNLRLQREQKALEVQMADLTAQTAAQAEAAAQTAEHNAIHKRELEEQKKDNEDLKDCVLRLTQELALTQANASAHASARNDGNQSTGAVSQDGLDVSADHLAEMYNKVRLEIMGMFMLFLVCAGR